ncbi:unnamed protein product, partial [Prorocentrum cordatum]
WACQMLATLAMGQMTRDLATVQVMMICMEAVTIILMGMLVAVKKEFALRLTVQPFEIWQESAAGAVGSAQVFIVSDPLHIDLFDCINGTCDRDQTCRWSPRPSDIDGCLFLDQPEVLRPRVKLSDTSVPVLSLMDELRMLGWAFEERAPSAGGSALDEDLFFDDAVMETGTCYACNLDDVLTNLPCRHDGHTFHQGCYEGVRAHWRSMSNFPAAKEANKQNYKNDPMAWRASVAPFLPSAEPEVRAQAVATAKREHAEIEEHVEKQFDQELEDDMLLTKSQYIGWMLNNEASTRTRRELGKDFDRLVEEQGDKHKNRNGESRVKHEGYGTLRKGKSNEVKKGALKVSEIDVETYSLKRRRQSILSRKIEDALNTLNGAAGEKTKMTTMSEKLASLDAKHQLPTKTDAIAKKADDQTEILKEKNGEVNHSTVENLASLERSAEVAIEQLEIAQRACKDHYEAMDFVFKDSKVQERKVYQAEHHQIMKVANSLISGGFKKRLGIAVARKIRGYPLAENALTNHALGVAAPEGDEAEYSGDAVQIFCSADTTIEKMVNQFMAESATKMEAKITTMDNLMLREAKAPGAIGRIQSSLQTFDFAPLPNDITLDADGGADPWMFTARFNAFRFGAAAVPLPGVGFVMKNWESQMYVGLFKIESLLDDGIVMPNAAKFLETDDGVKFFERSEWVVVPPKGVLSVPWGWVAMPVFYEPKKTTEWGHAWFLAKLSATEAKGCGTDVLKTIKAFNDDHMKGSAAVPMWKARATMFSQVMESVLDTNTAIEASSCAGAPGDAGYPVGPTGVLILIRRVAVAVALATLQCAVLRQVLVELLVLGLPSGGGPCPLQWELMLVLFRPPRMPGSDQTLLDVIIQLEVAGLGTLCEPTAAPPRKLFEQNSRKFALHGPDMKAVALGMDVIDGCSG